MHFFPISTLNFTCHFILQSLNLINSFCQSSHSILAFVVSPAMNNFTSAAPFVLSLFIPSSRWLMNMWPLRLQKESTGDLLLPPSCLLFTIYSTFRWKQLISNKRTIFLFHHSVFLNVWIWGGWGGSFWEHLLNTFWDSNGVSQPDHHVHDPTVLPKEFQQIQKVKPLLTKAMPMILNQIGLIQCDIQWEPSG